MEPHIDTKVSQPSCTDDGIPANGRTIESDHCAALTESNTSPELKKSIEHCAKSSNDSPKISRSKHGIRIKLNLVRAARKYLKLLKLVDSLELYDGARVTAAIYRYEKLWLPLLSQNDDKTLIAPPIDIHWVWVVHMLAPQNYNKDCETLFDKLLPHRLLSDNALLRGQQIAENLWTEAYPDDHWDLRDEDVGSPHYIHSSSLSYDLVKAVKRQSAFYYQVCLPHYECKAFLRKAELRYRRFIKLKKLYPGEFLVPTYDIDLMWHSHQIHPFIYRDDCLNLLGRLFPHDDSVNDREEGSKLRRCDQQTRERWCKTFGTTLRQNASMYRGDSPQTYLEHLPSIIENSRNANYSVKIIKIKITGKLKKGLIRLRLKQQSSSCSSPTKLAEFTVHHCGPEESEHVVAPMDISFLIPKQLCYNYIVLTVDYARGFRKLTKFLMPDSFWSLSTFNELINASGEIVKTFTDVKRRGTIELTLEVTKNICHSWLPMRISTGNFLPVCLDPKELCSLYGLTAMYDDSYHENSYTADKAVHGVFDDSSPKAAPELFEVWVTHSFQFMLSSIQIFAITDQKELVPVCIAHTLDHNTLASPDFLKIDPLKKICPPHMDLRKGQRAIIIKTAKGDYAIIVGWWEGRKQGIRASRMEAGVTGDPGYLVIRVWHPSSANRPYTQDVPYMHQQFSLFLNDLNIDLKNQRLYVSENTDDFLENLALGLAVTTLHVLVEPRPFLDGAEPDSRFADRAKPMRIPSENLPLLAAVGLACSATPTNVAVMRRTDRKNDTDWGGYETAMYFPLYTNDVACGACGGCGGCGGDIGDAIGGGVACGGQDTELSQFSTGGDDCEEWGDWGEDADCGGDGGDCGGDAGGCGGCGGGCGGCGG